MGLQNIEAVLKEYEEHELLATRKRPTSPVELGNLVQALEAFDVSTLPPGARRVVLEEARRTVFGGFGDASEVCALEELRKRGYDISMPQGKFKSVLGEVGGGCVVRLGGRVDGMLPDAVLEIKSRAHGLAFRIQEYEEPQVMAYMHLTGHRSAVLVERLPLRKSFLLMHRATWDQGKWEELRHALLAVAAFVCALVSDPELRAKFTKSRTKNAMIRKWTAAYTLSATGG